MPSKRGKKRQFQRHDSEPPPPPVSRGDIIGLLQPLEYWPRIYLPRATKLVPTYQAWMYHLQSISEIIGQICDIRFELEPEEREAAEECRKRLEQQFASLPPPPPPLSTDAGTQTPARFYRETKMVDMEVQTVEQTPPKKPTMETKPNPRAPPPPKPAKPSPPLVAPPPPPTTASRTGIRAVVVHAAPTKYKPGQMRRWVEEDNRGIAIAGVRWLLTEGRRLGKAASSLVIYLATPLLEPGHLRMGRKLFRTTEYDWDRPAADKGKGRA